MKKVVLTLSVLVLSLTLIFAQGKKGKKGQINLIPITNQQAIADSLAKLAQLDSLNKAIAARNQKPAPPAQPHSNGMFASADTFGAFLKDLGKDTTKRAREFTEAFKMMYPKKKVATLVKGKVYPLALSLAGWTDVRDSAGAFDIKSIPGNPSTDAFVVLTKSDYFFFNKRGAPLKEGEVLQAISSIKDRKVLNQVQGTLSAIRQELTEKAEQNSADLADGLKRIDDLSKGVEDQIGELSKTTTYLNDMQNFYFGGMDSATQLDFQKYRVWIHSDNDTLVRKAMAIAEKYNLNVKMEDASSGLADLKFYGMIACGVILVAFIALVLFMRKGTGTTRTP